MNARARRIARAFPAWYAVTLVVSLGTVETARATRGASPDPATEVVIRTEAVFEVPPKPDAAPTPREADGSGEPIYTVERCERLTGGYADACFAAVARQSAERDPIGANEACARIEEPERRMECQADVAEAHARVDLDASRAMCEGIERKKWRDQCVFGIATAFALVDPALALATCEESGQWRPFCRHDVNGERATVDPDGAVAYCRSLDPAKRDACWHGIGKYIGRIDVAKALSVCEQAPLEQDLRGQCVHGAGWAAAESRGDAAMALCEPLGIMRDSCILGVAYQHKRYDPERAAALCNEATDAGERQHCLGFVRR